jgi:hypothetical protein
MEMAEVGVIVKTQPLCSCANRAGFVVRSQTGVVDASQVKLALEDFRRASDETTSLRAQMQAARTQMQRLGDWRERGGWNQRKPPSASDVLGCRLWLSGTWEVRGSGRMF